MCGVSLKPQRGIRYEARGHSRTCFTAQPPMHHVDLLTETSAAIRRGGRIKTPMSYVSSVLKQTVVDG
jgi:hypothetical protein